jgi:ABC-2 type transport system permease protein
MGIINVGVIKALVLRYSFLYSRSSFRVLDIFFWPAMDLLVWGFMATYLTRINTSVPSAVSSLIAAAILWNILYRSQQSMTVSFLEDVWSRNFLNIFVAPVRVSEFIAATYTVGVIQTLVVLCVMSSMALLYSFNMFAMGVALMPFFGNLLIFGWAIGLVTTGLILRFGQQAEALAWAVPFLIQPISAVFYPVSVLPGWLQPIALLIPSTHVFEGMRAVLNGQGLQAPPLIAATALNAIYLFLGALFFGWIFQDARRRGVLAKIGT